MENAFGYVRLKGEITGLKQAASGHLYFSLKDENALVSAVCFRSAAQRISFEIGDGLEVVASGRITTYEGRSNYQIIVEKLEIAGIGALLEMIEKRRQKLLEEGIFDESFKKPIPFFPTRIGVITSETGAVIQDIKHRITARFPTHLILYPTLVQGDKAAAEIISGIRYFNNLAQAKKPDVLIIARGGGSFEDLLPFHDENLVRAVFKSEIPVISAVGHETDTTLIDYVADLRAPTPTAAAEMVTPILEDLKGTIEFLHDKLNKLPQQRLLEYSSHLSNLQKYLIDPRQILQQMAEKISNFAKNLDNSLANYLISKFQKLSVLQPSKVQLIQKVNAERDRLEYLFKQIESDFLSEIKNRDLEISSLAKMLKTNHYQEILNRGFALVRNSDGELISSVKKIEFGKNYHLEMSDGEVSVTKNSLV